MGEDEKVEEPKRRIDELKRNQRLFGALKSTLVQFQREMKEDKGLEKRNRIQLKLKEESQKLSKEERIKRDYYKRLKGLQCTKQEPKIYYCYA